MFVMTRPRSTMISILLSVFVFAVQNVVGCDFGSFGERCDRNCSLRCDVYPGKNVRICGKDTGSCLAGCIPGWYGDHCNLTCNKNCIDSICNQKNGHCTIGCAEKYQGDFCEKEKEMVTHKDKRRTKKIITCPRNSMNTSPSESLTQVEPTTFHEIQATKIVPDNRCLPGQFGDACDHICPPRCAVGSGQSVGICERDTGKCHDGCQSGWHGDHCNLPSVDNISRVNHTRNQGNRDQVSIPNKEETSTTHILITVSVILNVFVVVFVVVFVLLMCLLWKKPGWRLRDLCRNQEHSENPAQDKERKIFLPDPTHQAVNGNI